MINDRFVIKKKLGEGRSKVFLCSDIENQEKDFAIKVLSSRADNDEIKTFRNEFFILQKLNHPNIIASYEEGVVVKTGEDEVKAGDKFIILDYFPGVELLEYNELNNEDCLKEILTQLCSVLYYLHQSNYIYYDLKPENILVSKTGGKPLIKLIDMGFAHHQLLQDKYLTRGTTEYIAPEILKNESYNHQVDLYSLGIMLYRIVYGKFPFKSESGLDIYKEHIESEFEFPESRYSSEFIEVIKKLVIKDPVNRYANALQVLNDLNIEISKDIVKDFAPANVFADREELIAQTDSYLHDNNNRDALVIPGAEGSGKTSFIYQIYSTYKRVVLVSDTGRRKGVNFIQYLLRKIIYSEFVYPVLNENIITLADKIFSGKSTDLITDLKSILTKLSLDIKFTIIIDNLDQLDEFTLDICKEILPILQVNGIKIILCERSGNFSSKVVNRAQQINLSSFTHKNLTEYLDVAFATFFPKDQLKQLIISHSDLLPGSIINFIRDLILLKVIRFLPDGPEIDSGEKTEKLLESSHEEIFKLRLSLLTESELKVAQFLSSFENLPEINVTVELNNLSVEEFYNITKKLEEKNILQVSNIVNTFSFTSDSLKKYVYSTIDSKEDYHIKIANTISAKFRIFNRQELARQYELGRNFTESYKILSEEIGEADKLSAYSYKKNLLNHLLQLPLPEDNKLELNFELSLTLYKLNDAKTALNIVESLLTNETDERIKKELLILKGSCLIELGELEKGKSLLNDLVKDISDEVRKQKLMVEIAYAEFDLGRYDIAKNICYEIINDENTPPEEKGKCYNLLGLLDFYQSNDLDAALGNFKDALKIYKAANLLVNVSKMEGNIGNTYHRKGDYNNAEKYWNESIRTNLSVGNLDQEAKILLNTGFFYYYYNKLSFEKAIEQCKRAYDIFLSLGNKYGQGLVLTNLGEINLKCCEYQAAFESLSQARDIFIQLLNKEEEAGVLFILGKFYFALGDREQLERLIKDFKFLINKKHLTENHVNNHKFLELIYSSDGIKTEKYLDTYRNVLNAFNEQGEKIFFAEANSILCETLIQYRMFEVALGMLNDDEFLSVCKENLLFNAEKKYLEGLIALQSDRFKLPPPIESLDDAYNLIKDGHITELTWKILYALGENYLKRGNLKKAQDYFFYSKEVLNFISDNIKNDDMRDKYLSKPERKVVLDKIETIENS